MRSLLNLLVIIFCLSIISGCAKVTRDKSWVYDKNQETTWEIHDTVDKHGYTDKAYSTYTYRHAHAKFYWGDGFIKILMFGNRVCSV